VTATLNSTRNSFSLPVSNKEQHLVDHVIREFAATAAKYLSSC